MFNCTFIPAQNQQPAVLQVSGEATIQNILQFKEAVVEGLTADAGLIIDGSHVTAADLSCLQLLCSAHRTCQTLRLTPGTLVALQEVIDPSGFARVEGCCLAADKQSCIWICQNTAA